MEVRVFYHRFRALRLTLLLRRVDSWEATGGKRDYCLLGYSGPVRNPCERLLMHVVTIRTKHGSLYLARLVSFENHSPTFHVLNHIISPGAFVALDSPNQEAYIPITVR